MRPDRSLPIGEYVRMDRYLVECDADSYEIQCQVDDDDTDGDADRLIEAFQENSAEHSYQHECDDDLMIEKLKIVLDERVLDDMRGCVGGRKSDGDDKACRNKTEKHQYEHLPFPTRQKLFKHRDGPVAVRTLFSYSSVHWQRAE